MFWDTLLLMAAVLRFVYTAMMCRLAAAGAYRLGRLAGYSDPRAAAGGPRGPVVRIGGCALRLWFRVFGEYLEPWTGDIADLELMDCEGCR